MKRLGKIYQAISILVYTFLFAAIWFPWMTYSGKNYSLPGYIRMVGQEGGIVDLADGAPDMVASYYLFFLPMAASVFAGIYIVSRLLKKPLKLAYVAVRWCE